GERLQGGDVERVQAAAALQATSGGDDVRTRRLRRLASCRMRSAWGKRRRWSPWRGRAQFDKRRQESGQCLAGAGRGNQQRGTVFTRLRQQLKLVFARAPSARGEPSAETVRQQRGVLGRRSGDDAGRHGKTGKPLRRFRRGPAADESRPLPRPSLITPSPACRKCP